MRTGIRTYVKGLARAVPSRVHLILVCLLLLPPRLLVLLELVLISQQEIVFKVTELLM